MWGVVTAAAMAAAGVCAGCTKLQSARQPSSAPGGKPRSADFALSTDQGWTDQGLALLDANEGHDDVVEVQGLHNCASSALPGFWHLCGTLRRGMRTWEAGMGSYKLALSLFISLLFFFMSAF